MIDTDKSEIPWHSWREMKNHTPWGLEWFMLDAQNYQDVPFKTRERYQEGLVGCVIKFHMTDTRWDDNEAMVADANQALIRNAPRLYAEVMRLREQVKDLEYRMTQGAEAHRRTGASDSEGAGTY
jgi:hypothetical protein